MVNPRNRKMADRPMRYALKEEDNGGFHNFKVGIHFFGNYVFKLPSEVGGQCLAERTRQIEASPKQA